MITYVFFSLIISYAALLLKLLVYEDWYLIIDQTHNIHYRLIRGVLCFIIYMYTVCVASVLSIFLKRENAPRTISSGFSIDFIMTSFQQCN